jgi:hypothetical protein
MSDCFVQFNVELHQTTNLGVYFFTVMLIVTNHTYSFYKAMLQAIEYVISTFLLPAITVP